MGTERILIEITEQGARVVQGKIGDIGKTAREAHGGVDLLKRTLLGLGAGFSVAQIVSTMTSFSREMARVQVATGAVGQQMGALSAAAREMGAETGAGADAAARSLGILARSGFASAQSTGALRDALRLASAVGSDATAVTSSLANIMQAFRLEAGEAGKAVDILALASTRSSGGFEELSAGVLRMSAAARAAGLDLADAATLVSVLNDSGLEGRIAISELRGALEELETPTDRTKATFISLGLDIERLRPSAVGLATVLDELGRRDVRLEGLGIRGGRALDILADRTGDVRELLGELEKATGTADRFADIMEDSLAGSFTKVKASVDNLILAFGGEDGLAGAIKTVADGINNLAVSVSAVKTQTQSLFEFILLSRGQREELLKLRAAERRLAADSQRAGGLPEPAPKGDGVLRLGGGPDITSSLGGGDGFPAGPGGDGAINKIERATDTLRVATEADITRVQITDELVGARGRLLATEEALAGLLQQNLITQDQYNLSLARATLENQGVADTLDVVKAKFLEVDTSANALAASISDGLVGAIDAASGALADFAISGFRDVENLKKALSNLLADLGKQILQLIIKTLILRAIQAGINAVGGGGAVGTAISNVDSGALIAAGGSRAAGGGVRMNEPVWVGENGPEIFTPPTSGHVVPNNQIAGAAPQVNVRINNVRDPNEVTEAMNSSEGEQVIMNTLAKNREALRQVLGGV